MVPKHPRHDPRKAGTSAQTEAARGGLWMFCRTFRDMTHESLRRRDVLLVLSSKLGLRTPV